MVKCSKGTVTKLQVRASKMFQWVKALVTCLYLVFIAEINHLDQRQLRGKGFI